MSLRQGFAVLLLLLLLVGCAPRPAAITEQLTPTADTAAPIVIPFFTTETDPKQLDFIQQAIAEYQAEHPGIEVDIIIARPAERGRRLLTALASGADLGIFEVEPTLMPLWVQSGYLLPLNDIVANIGEQDFIEGSLYRQDGQVFAVPYASSVYGLWVRKDLLEAANLPIPTTYDELLADAQTLTQDGMYGIALPAGHNIATINYFSVFLWQNGGDYFTCDGQVAFGQRQALQAVQRWAALAQFAPPGYNTWSYSEQIDTFLNERVAMSLYGGRLGVQLVETRPEMAEQVTVIFPPFGDVPVTLGIWNRFAIGAGTKHPEEAKDFLQWLITGDRLLRFDTTVPGHMVPPLKSIRQQALRSDDPVTQAHRDWILSFYHWTKYTNHPAMNMGSVHDGVFQRSENVPPWAWEVFGTPGPIDTMLQEIANGRAPELTWQDAVQTLEQTVADWKAEHPAWRGECQP